MSTFKNKNSLRTIEAQIAQKVKNNEARPKFTGSYKKKKRVDWFRLIYTLINLSLPNSSRENSAFFLD